MYGLLTLAARFFEYQKRKDAMKSEYFKIAVIVLQIITAIINYLI